MSKPAEVEPEIAAILRAARIRPTRVTYIKHGQPCVFTIDVGKHGLRLIYSRGFVDMVRGMPPFVTVTVDELAAALKLGRFPEPDVDPVTGASSE